MYGNSCTQDEHVTSVISHFITDYTHKLTLVTVISLMVNSGKSNTELYWIDSGLPETGTNGVSAFSGQYCSHFFYRKNMNII